MSAQFASSDFAEAAFYEAINKGNLSDLMTVWSEDEDVVCIHPTGQHFQGLVAIREGWQRVIAQRLRVTPSLIYRWESVLTAVHLVQETLFVGDDETPHGPLFSTNLYVRGPKGWRLVLHHSSAAVEAAHAVMDTRVLH